MDALGTHSAVCGSRHPIHGSIVAAVEKLAQLAGSKVIHEPFVRPDKRQHRADAAWLKGEASGGRMLVDATFVSVHADEFHLAGKTTVGGAAQRAALKKVKHYEAIGLENGDELTPVAVDSCLGFDPLGAALIKNLAKRAASAKGHNVARHIQFAMHSVSTAAASVFFFVMTGEINLLFSTHPFFTSTMNRKGGSGNTGQRQVVRLPETRWKYAPREAAIIIILWSANSDQARLSND